MSYEPPATAGGAVGRVVNVNVDEKQEITMHPDNRRVDEYALQRPANRKARPNHQPELVLRQELSPFDFSPSLSQMSTSQK